METKDDDLMLNPVYKDGYNFGYTLAEFDPKIAKHLSEVESKASIIQGIKAGKEQFDREQMFKANEKQPAWLEKGRLTKAFNQEQPGQPVQNNRHKDKDIER